MVRETIGAAYMASEASPVEDSSVRQARSDVPEVNGGLARASTATADS